jgi:hypothetical protein
MPLERGARLEVKNDGDPTGLYLYIDYEPWPPRLHGTGSEDYFNTGFGPHDVFNAPYQGMTVSSGTPEWPWGGEDLLLPLPHRGRDPLREVDPRDHGARGGELPEPGHLLHGLLAPARAAPHLPASARRRGAAAQARRVGLGVRGVASVPVPTSLPHIPAHVVDAQLVRVLRTHGVRLGSGALAMPRHIPYCVAAGVLMPLAQRPATRRELSLRFRGQPVAVPREVARRRVPGDGIARVQPGHGRQRVAVRYGAVPARRVNRP